MLTHEQIVQVMKEMASSFLTGQRMDRDDEYSKKDNPSYWHESEYDKTLGTISLLFGARLIDAKTETFLRNLALRIFYPNIKNDL